MPHKKPCKGTAVSKLSGISHFFIMEREVLWPFQSGVENVSYCLPGRFFVLQFFCFVFLFFFVFVF